MLFEANKIINAEPNVGTKAYRLGKRVFSSNLKTAYRINMMPKKLAI